MTDPNADTVDYEPAQPVGARRDRNPGPVGLSLPHVGPQVRRLLDALNQYAGVGQVVNVRWLRTGKGAFSLIKFNASLSDMLGPLGEVRIEGLKLPMGVEHPSLSYSINGGRIKAVAGCETDLSNLEQTRTAVGSAGPVGSPFMILSAFSFIWTLFHSKIELALPSNIEANLVLKSPEMLHVDFVSGPTVEAVIGLSLTFKPEWLDVDEAGMTTEFPGPLFGWFTMHKRFTW